MNKKDKKKFKRKNIRLKNIEIDNLNEFEDDEVVEDKRATHKTSKKGKKSTKSDLDLKEARVIEVLSNNKCKVKFDNEVLECVISGRLKHVTHKTRTIIAVGDIVNIDIANENRIEEILPRKNSLSRFTEDSFQKEVILAANVDQVVITGSFFEPDLNLGLIDRYLCVANIFDITAIICINKIDLAYEEIIEELDFYKQNGYKVIFTSIKTGQGISELKNQLQNCETVFSGASGVGKSSLINLLQPGLNLRVSEVSDYSGKGMHTTTSARLIEWNFGGFLVDTPGIRSLTLLSKFKNIIPDLFPGFDRYLGGCKFLDCTHTHEIKCGVKEAVEKGLYSEEHYESYLRIMESL
ncbi:MAG: ribosome small subunit-dependent GTPase A [Candidatus Cloacimonetes bacterium]|nr:ribosome small subunit-dependent GTPase A [Candidatus Cloacimonadota bacterium]